MSLNYLQLNEEFAANWTFCVICFSTSKEGFSLSTNSDFKSIRGKFPNCICQFIRISKKEGAWCKLKGTEVSWAIHWSYRVTAILFALPEKNKAMSVTHRAITSSSPETQVSPIKHKAKNWFGIHWVKSETIHAATDSQLSSPAFRPPLHPSPRINPKRPTVKGWSSRQD